MAEWTYRRISANYYPRQFEFHPCNEEVLFGTIFGEVCTANLNTNQVELINECGADDRDTVLGLCWLKSSPSLYLCGTAKGRICCGDISKRFHIVQEYPEFHKLTSIHVNRTNSTLLVSGYSTTVGLYDLETSQCVRKYNHIHSDNINISRFANHSPHLFGTSSFDGTIKLWDLRQRASLAELDETPPLRENQTLPVNQGQIYTIQCGSGVVMINFSADDTYLLASAQDNEINQYCFLNGGHNFRFSINKTGLSGNFTRAYYSASGKHVITGACEQNSVKMLCTYTGSYLCSVSMTPIMRDESIYVQSLRGSPYDDNKLCVLTNYRDIPNRELIYVCAHPPKDEGLSPNSEEEEDIQFTKGTHSSPLVVPSYHFLDELYALRCVAHIAGEERVLSFDGEEELLLGNPRRDLVYFFHSSFAQSTTHSPTLLSSATTMTTLSSPSPTIPTTSSSSCSSSHPSLSSSTTPSFVAVHGFILVARCFTLCQATQAAHSAHANVDLSPLLTEDEWRLFPLVVDYLYAGVSALDIYTVRRYALSRLPEEDCRFLLRKYAYLVEQYVTILNEEDEPEQVPLSEKERWGNMECALSLDAVCWRTDSCLTSPLLHTMFALHSMGQTLQLPQLIDQVVYLLSTVLDVMNALEIWHWGNRNQYKSLCTAAEKFIAMHYDVILENTPTDIMREERLAIDSTVRSLWEKSLIEVRSRASFEIALMAQQALIDATRDESGGTSMLSMEYCRSIEQLSRTWQREESPMLCRGEDEEHPYLATILSAAMWHASCNVMDDSILFFGGMNKERLNTFTRLLVYDMTTDRFRHVHCSGNDLPTSAYMHICVPLQKHRTTHIALFGGKLLMSEVPVRLPPYRRNIIWEDCDLNALSSSTSSSSSSPSSSFTSASTTIATDGDREAHHEGHGVEGGHGKSHHQEKKKKKRLAPVQRDPSQAYLFELDYSKLTWLRKKVEMVEPSVHPSRPSNARFSTEHNRTTFKAFKSRIAQGCATIYSEDLSYRCPKCLFQIKSSGEITGHRVCAHDYHGQPVTWSLQIGGYCPDVGSSMSDLHVMTTSFNSQTQSYDYSWMRVHALGASPSSRFSHTASFVPLREIQARGGGGRGGHLRYDRVLIVGGVVPEIFQLPVIVCDVHSLRITNVHDALDLQWETIERQGTQPPAMSGHTLTHIPSTQSFLLMGGMIQSHHRDTLNPEIYLLSFSEVECNQDISIRIQWSRLTTSGPTPSLRSRHTSNMARGLPRFESSQCVLFVFGGLDETQERENDNKAAEPIMHRLVLDVNRRDRGLWLDTSTTFSRMLHIESVPTVSLPSCSLGMDMRRLVYPAVSDAMVVEREPSSPPCPLTIANRVLHPDLVVSFGAEQDVHVFSTLVAHRSPVLGTLLSNNMVEAQTGVIRLPEGPSVFSIVQYMEYLCADFLSLVSTQQAVDMLELGNQHQVLDLIRRCEGALLRLVDPTTALELLELAETYDLALLRSSCYSQLLRAEQHTLHQLLYPSPTSPSEDSIDASKLLSDTLTAFRDYVAKNVHVYKHNLPDQVRG